LAGRKKGRKRLGSEAEHGAGVTHNGRKKKRNVSCRPGGKRGRLKKGICGKGGTVASNYTTAPEMQTDPARHKLPGRRL